MIMGAYGPLHPRHRYRDASLSAQSKPTVEQLLDRMRAYLAEYETQLSSVVADERFEQRVVYTRAYQGGLPDGDDDSTMAPAESEIGFIRLPGGVDWLGFRHVRKSTAATSRDIDPWQTCWPPTPM